MFYNFIIIYVYTFVVNSSSDLVFFFLLHINVYIPILLLFLFYNSSIEEFVVNILNKLSVKFPYMFTSSVC